ncbi:MAG: NAD(P)H-dependent oxidoreductase [Candidatus Kerfeldbacteria bacterium]|nr:NAD(P)H-dependent oxidoreductase [Candidatus Kerfeldbacteria bacterium]
MKKIAIIIGSTRQNRQGERVGQWAHAVLKSRTDCAVDLIDLRDWPLPFYAEPASPSALHGQYSHPIATQWAATIAQYHGFIIVTPEYNHGYSAVLKNALDYLYQEWNHKPVACIGYSSGNSGAIRAIEQLRQVFIELQMIPLQPEMNLCSVKQLFDEAGNTVDPKLADRLQRVVDSLIEFIIPQ